MQLLTVQSKIDDTHDDEARIFVDTTNLRSTKVHLPQDLDVVNDVNKTTIRSAHGQFTLVQSE